ncbi:MAG: vitamin K epoxide reductase family protein [Candidatus Sulfotelmatobacter sp.]
MSETSDHFGASGGSSAIENRGLFLAIAILALAGMIVSSISLQRHYAKSASKFCDFSEKFSCDVVNRSEYSSLVGIPVAGIGVAGYGALLALATFYRSRVQTPIRLLLAALAGLAFALYLTYVEAYVLDTWCILCLSSLAMITLITLLAAVLQLRTRS